MRKHYRLMIPGPIEVSPDVLAHMSDPLTAHYGDRWVEIWRKDRIQSPARDRDGRRRLPARGIGPHGQ